MIKDQQFDGRAWSDPYKHIAEFVEICRMFRYGNNNVDAIKLKLFASSLFEDAKVWFNELSPDVITTWEEMRQAFISRFFSPAMFDQLMGEVQGFAQHPYESFVDAWLRIKDLLRSYHRHGLGRGIIIQIFYHGLDEAIQAILDAEGIVLYKTPNEAHQLLKERVLLKLDWRCEMDATVVEDHTHRQSVMTKPWKDPKEKPTMPMEDIEEADIEETTTINEASLDKEFEEFTAFDVEEINKQKEEVENNFEELTLEGNLRIKTSIQDPQTDLEMKPLPKHLEYAFLEKDSLLSIVISTLLKDDEKKHLESVLKKQGSVCLENIRHFGN
uniref:Reverse transcriptase domain-containing protein n=1 Tax=Tanacetum cinerariifolium TaxID=118510 RepID=A0A699GLK7_TANCI|nr:reverse transcriptase domain-containing protein [Tanacetum cinerariifolium]